MTAAQMHPKATNFSRLVSPIAAMALALAEPGVLAAQAAADTTRLTPVVVTATRVAGSQAAPFATATRLDGEELRARGVVRISDALREVPGLTIARSGSAGAVTSVFLRGGESDYVQVLIDGVIANEPGGAVDFANLTTDDIDRIEIVRGPVSVLYGSEAVSGVVQIFTRRGEAPRFTAGVRAGSHGTREADAAVGGRGLGWDYSLGAARRTSDGALAFNNAHRNTTLTGSVGTAAGSSTDLRLTGRATDGRYNFPTDFSGALVDSNQYSFERRIVTGLDVAQRLGSRTTARVALTSSLVDAGTDDRPDNAADTAGSFASRSTRESARHGADLRIDQAIARAGTFTAGVDLDWERQQTGFSSEHGTFGPYQAPDRDDRRWNRGYYAQLLGEAAHRLSYTAGLRLDDNETFGEFVTYRLGSGVQLPFGTTLRAAVGTAFKAPIFYEITGAGFAEPNEEIQPERSRSWDAGVEHSFAPLGRAVTVGATYFEQRFRDMIQYIPNPADPFAVGQYRNIAGARTSGFELEARAVLGDRLTMLANGTVLETRVTEAREGGELAFQPGEPLIRRPRLSGNVVATLRTGGALIGASVNHVGARDDVDFAAFERVRLPSYTTVDASLEFPLFGSGRIPALRVQGRVENLLDEGYSAVAGFPQPGRTVLLGLSAAFGR